MDKIDKWCRKRMFAEVLTFAELGGKNELFAASLIAAPCFGVLTLWTWAIWYKVEQHDQAMGKEQKEGWFKLLGIKTPPPPINFRGYA